MNATLEEIWNQFVAYDRIVIHRHLSPDPDAIGSQMGLARLLRHNYPEKEIWTVGYREPSLAWIGLGDRVPDDAYEGALVVVTDTANSERIDDERYKNGMDLIKIDHHPPHENYGRLNYVDTQAAASCEIIMELFQANQKIHQLTMPLDAAQALYAGIIADSGRFLYDSTTVRTLERVQALYAYGIDRNAIHANLYKRTLNVVQAEGYVLSQFKVTEAGVAYYQMDQPTQKSFGLTTGTRAALVGTLANIEGVKVWVNFFENEDGKIRANIRSGGPVINEVAAQFNGGGHPKASGALLKSWDDCPALIEALDQVCRN